MRTHSPFEIKLGRPLTGTLFAVSSLFIFLALDVSFLHVLTPSFTFHVQSVAIWALAAIFFGIIPCVIALKMIKLFIRPPTLLRIDKETISFGTGFNYTPHSIPTHLISSVSLGAATPSLTDVRPESWLLFSGIKVMFKKDEHIPSGLATSAGITYAYNTLKIRGLYMNTLPTTAVKMIREYLPIA